MKKLVIFVLSLSFCLPMVSARGLRAIESDGIQISEDNRESVATYTTDDGIQISVVVEESRDSDYYRYGVDIVNLSDEDFRFKESSITIYQGDYDRDRWREIRFEDPSDFYHSKETELKVESVFTALAFGAAIIDAFTPPPPGHRYRHYIAPVPVPVPHTASGAVFLGLGIAGIFEQVEDQNNLDYLKENLLFSTTIAPGDEYSGIIYVPRERGPDYRFEMKLADKEYADFYFSKNRRSSRREPARSKVEVSRKTEHKSTETREVTEKTTSVEVKVDDKSKLGLLFSFGLPLEGVPGFGGYVIYSEPVLGFYIGFDGYGNVGDYSIGEMKGRRFEDIRVDAPYRYPGKGYSYYMDKNIKDERRDYGCFSTGITVSPIPGLSALFGVGLDFSEAYYYGDIYVHDEYSDTADRLLKAGWIKDSLPYFSFSPQIGVSTVIGSVNLAAMYTYRIGDTYSASRVNVMAGLAF